MEKKFTHPHFKSTPGYVSPKNADTKGQRVMINELVPGIRAAEGVGGSPLPKAPEYSGVPGYDKETQTAAYLHNGNQK